MITKSARQYAKNLARLLRLSFPDADNQGDEVVGTPLAIRVAPRQKLSRDVVVDLMDMKRHTDKPQLLVTKLPNREAVVHMTLDTFMTFVERFFWSPPEEADIIPFPTKEQP